MYSTTKDLSDGKTNVKIFVVLAMIGAFLGALAGYAHHFQSLPRAAKTVLHGEIGYVIAHNLAALPVSPRAWQMRRARVWQSDPGLAHQLDQFPAVSAAGAAGGALALPLALWYLLIVIKSTRERVRKKRQTTPAETSLKDL